MPDFRAELGACTVTACIDMLWWLGMRIMEPAAFIMTRRMVLGVKERAETLRASAYDNGPPAHDFADHGCRR